MLLYRRNQRFCSPDENDCAPPTIPKGKYNTDPKGWYEEGEVIRVTCDLGHEHKNNVAAAKCINGTWSSIPVCVSKSAARHLARRPSGRLARRPSGRLAQVSEPSACSQ